MLGENGYYRMASVAKLCADYVKAHEILRKINELVDEAIKVLDLSEDEKYEIWKLESALLDAMADKANEKLEVVLV